MLNSLVRFLEKRWTPVLSASGIVLLVFALTTIGFVQYLGDEGLGTFEPPNSPDSGGGGGGSGGGWGQDPPDRADPHFLFPDWEIVALVSGVWVSTLGFVLGAFFNFRRENREKEQHSLEIQKLELEIMEMKTRLKHESN